MAANIHHSSSSVEWYTPKWLVDRCRSVLGGIDCDPCSCEDAQKIVGANNWFDEKLDGLSQSWYGNIFMNPPGGWATPEVADKWGSRSNAQCWYAKLLYEMNSGNALNAIVLCFNLDTLRALQPKAPICILKSRCKFDKIENDKRVSGGSPAHGTGLILLSDSVKMQKEWVEWMSPYGMCYKASG